MSLIPSHTQDSICPLCLDKLQLAHPYLQAWFKKKKLQHHDLHISWSYRGKDDQEKAFSEGKTHQHFPNSSHNQNGPDEIPRSMALDLFFVDQNGRAIWDREICGPLYRKLWDECVANGDEMIWGGNFKSLGDFDHFQFNPNAKS